MNDLVSVEFYGDSLEATQTPDGRVWVSLRRCCESLGVAVQRQLEKLKSKHWACVTEMVTRDTSGRNQSAVMVELDTLPLWLASIEPNKVNPEVRDKLVRYQKEAAKVLADHFYGRREPYSPHDIIESMRSTIASLVAEAVAKSIPVIPDNRQLYPTWSVQERLRIRGYGHWDRKRRAAVSSYACSMLYMRLGETPTRSDLSGGGCYLFHPHQLSILDEAIDRLLEEARKRGQAHNTAPTLFTSSSKGTL